jgi:hypothetical protein
MTRPENARLAMTNNQFDRASKFLKIINVQTYTERLNAVIAACFYKVLTQVCEYLCNVDMSVFHF